MALEFITTDFVRDHGHSPRGRGGWAFAISRNPQPEEIFWAYGLYVEAKRQARVHFAGQDTGGAVWVLC